MLFENSLFDTKKLTFCSQLMLLLLLSALATIRVKNLCDLLNLKPFSKPLKFVRRAQTH